MDDWMIILRGDERDLEDLSIVFTTPDLIIKKVVEKDYQFYSLTSSQFTPSLQYNHVKNESQKIVENLTALCKLYWESRKPIEIDGIRHYHGDGKISVFVEGKIAGSSRDRTSLMVAKKGGTDDVSDPSDPLRRGMTIAQKDARVAKAFRYYREPSHPWSNYCKIIEIMEEDRFKPIMRGGIHKKEANRGFRKTPIVLYLSTDYGIHGKSPRFCVT